MFASAHETRNSTTEVDKTVRSFYFAGLGDTSHQTTVQCRVYAAGTDKGTPMKKFFPDNIEIRSTRSRGTAMVNKQYQFVNREIINSAK